jgi:hypothetical protein
MLLLTVVENCRGDVSEAVKRDVKIEATASTIQFDFRQVRRPLATEKEKNVWEQMLRAFLVSKAEGTEKSPKEGPSSVKKWARTLRDDSQERITIAAKLQMAAKTPALRPWFEIILPIEGNLHFPSDRVNTSVDKVWLIICRYKVSRGAATWQKFSVDE